MKRLIFILPLLTVLLLAIATSGNTAHAQETCRDATGAEIPCPPPSDPTGGGSDDDSNSGSGSTPQPGGGNPGPSSVVTPTFTPELTNTPLPEQAVPTVVSPTPTDGPVISTSNDGDTDGGEWTGFCSGNKQQIFKCTATFSVGCLNAGGELDIIKEDSTGRYIKYTIPSSTSPEDTLGIEPYIPNHGDDSWMVAASEGRRLRPRSFVSFELSFLTGLIENNYTFAPIM